MYNPPRAIAAIAFATCRGVTRRFPWPIPKYLLSPSSIGGSCSRLEVVPFGILLEIIPDSCLKFLLVLFFLMAAGGGRIFRP